MEKELISIIVPVYKAERYIKTCIESLIEQSYKNLEIIFVLDGITDNSKKIIEEYQKRDSRIVVLEKENTGAIDSRKAGVKIAKGQYVIFVDSDDWIRLETIEEMVEVIHQYQCDVVKAGIIRKEEENEIMLAVTKQDQYITKADFTETIYKEILSSYKHNSMVVELIRKDKIPLEKIKKGLVLGEDLNFNIELYGKIESIVLLKKCYYYYRYNQESVTNNLNLQTLNKYMQDIFVLTQKELQQVKYWGITNDETIRDIYLYMLYRITTYSLHIFEIQDIENKTMKEFFQDIVNHSEMKKIKQMISPQDIVKLKSISKVFMKWIYEGNVNLLIFCGRKIHLVTKKLKNKLRRKG